MKGIQNSNVINQILDYIHVHKLLPGDPMPTEYTLMEHLGVSRSTLREAIRELRTLQIVEVHHGFGSFVGSGSLDFLSKALAFRTQAPGRKLACGLIELIEVRAILEVSLADQVIKRLTPAQITKLYAATERMEQNKENSEPDRDFHTILYENINNDIARQLIAAFWDSFDQAQISLPITDQVIAPKLLHQEIIAAYRSGNVQKAKQSMSEHFRFIRNRLEQARKAGL